MTDHTGLNAGSSAAPEQPAPGEDYVDGTPVSSDPALNYKSLLDCVREKIEVRNQSSTSYQTAIKNVIGRAVVGSLKGWAHPDALDMSKYKTASAWLISSGVLQVRRVPKEYGIDMRPIVVTITAQQVADEYLAILLSGPSEPDYPPGDPDCWDYIDGVTSFSRPSLNGKSLFDCVREKTNLAHQSSEVYQTAIRNVIGYATAQAVGVVGLTAYKTASVSQIDSGELLVRRVPKEPAAGLQPVSVDITAQQVIDEYIALL